MMMTMMTATVGAVRRYCRCGYCLVFYNSKRRRSSLLNFPISFWLYYSTFTPAPFLYKGLPTHADKPHILFFIHSDSHYSIRNDSKTANETVKSGLQSCALKHDMHICSLLLCICTMNWMRIICTILCVTCIFGGSIPRAKIISFCMRNTKRSTAHQCNHQQE